MALALSRDIPAHVRPELVVTLPLYSRAALVDNPHEVLVPEMHRRLPPICYVPNIFPGDQPAWLLMKAEDVHDVLRNAENFTKNGMGKFAQSIGEDWISIPTETDPPVHAVYRQAINPYFTPSRMFAMRDQLRARARNLIAAFAARGHCDFIAEFSEQFPIFVALELLGLPHERVAQFLAWVKVLIHGNDWEERTRTVHLVKDYLLGEIDRRQRAPIDDYITHVTKFEFNGRPWTRDERLGHCFNLFIGGLDTVTSMLGNLFRFFADNPDRQDELRADLAKVPLAIEELLRAYAPVTVFRVASREFQIRGETIKPGDYVTVSTPVIGRDPSFYDAPDEVRFDRKPRHISLGDGIHRCLGMHLARLELQIALEEFLTVLPRFRIEDGFTVRYHTGTVQFLKELHLQW
jgi:cytochrome P450